MKRQRRALLGEVLGHSLLEKTPARVWDGLFQGGSSQPSSQEKQFLKSCVQSPEGGRGKGEGFKVRRWRLQSQPQSQSMRLDLGSEISSH